MGGGGGNGRAPLTECIREELDATAGLGIPRVSLPRIGVLQPLHAGPGVAGPWKALGVAPWLGVEGYPEREEPEAGMPTPDPPCAATWAAAKGAGV